VLIHGLNYEPLWMLACTSDSRRVLVGIGVVAR